MSKRSRAAAQQSSEEEEDDALVAKTTTKRPAKVRRTKKPAEFEEDPEPDDADVLWHAGEAKEGEEGSGEDPAKTNNKQADSDTSVDTDDDDDEGESGDEAMDDDEGDEANDEDAPPGSRGKGAASSKRRRNPRPAAAAFVDDEAEESENDGEDDEPVSPEQALETLVSELLATSAQAERNGGMKLGCVRKTVALEFPLPPIDEAAAAAQRADFSEEEQLALSLIRPDHGLVKAVFELMVRGRAKCRCPMPPMPTSPVKSANAAPEAKAEEPAFVDAGVRVDHHVVLAVRDLHVVPPNRGLGTQFLATLANIARAVPVCLSLRGVPRGVEAPHPMERLALRHKFAIACNCCLDAASRDVSQVRWDKHSHAPKCKESDWTFCHGVNFGPVPTASTEPDEDKRLALGHLRYLNIRAHFTRYLDELETRRCEDMEGEEQNDEGDCADGSEEEEEEEGREEEAADASLVEGAPEAENDNAPDSPRANAGEPDAEDEEEEEEEDAEESASLEAKNKAGQAAEEEEEEEEDVEEEEQAEKGEPPCTQPR